VAKPNWTTEKDALAKHWLSAVKDLISAEVLIREDVEACGGIWSGMTISFKSPDPSFAGDEIDYLAHEMAGICDCEGLSAPDSKNGGGVGHTLR
jgi:hypothetical protein